MGIDTFNDAIIVYNSKKKNEANFYQYGTNKIIYGKAHDAISHGLISTETVLIPVYRYTIISKKYN